MAERFPGSRPLHLLEFGLVWPAEAFIAAKFERLGSLGMKITVASPPSPGKSALRNVEVLGVIVTDVRVLDLRSRLRALWSLIVLLASRPRRGLAVFRAAGLPNAAGEPILRRERWARRLVYARIARRRPDVIQFEWESAAVDYCSLIDALGVPAVMSCRGRPLAQVLRPSRRRIALGLSSVFERVAAAHCVSDAVAREATELGLDPGKVHVIRGAVDSKYFCPPSAERHADDQLRVVSVGHLRWLKGHEYAVLAIAELVRVGIPVVLEIIGGDPHPEVGELSERARISYISEHLGLGDCVRLLGACSRDQTRSRLQQADVLLHASLTEGLPNAVLEAMACGLPVVATDVGGTSEALQHGVEGFLVAPRDPSAAARALAALWRDRELRRRMGEAGRARAQAQFTPEHQTDEWMRLYADVARRGRSRTTAIRCSGA
jgi:glycosyltransferase involved in cell wall biosynthesis